MLKMEALQDVRHLMAEEYWFLCLSLEPMQEAEILHRGTSGTSRGRQQV